MNTELTAVSYLGPSKREGIVPLYRYTGLDKDIYLAVRTLDHVGAGPLTPKSAEGIFDAIAESRGGKWGFRLIVYRPSIDDGVFHEIDIRKYEDLNETEGQSLTSVVRKVGPATWHSYTREQFESFLPDGAIVPTKNQSLFQDHIADESQLRLRDHYLELEKSRATPLFVMLDIAPLYTYKAMKSTEKDAYLVVETEDSGLKIVDETDEIKEAITTIREGNRDFRLFLYFVDSSNSFYEVRPSYRNRDVREIGFKESRIDFIRYEQPTWQFYTREEMDEMLPPGILLPSINQKLFKDYIPDKTMNILRNNLGYFSISTSGTV